MVPMAHRLLSLLDPSFPLLVRLRMQALGTYVHSLLVGQMAAFAAEVLPGVDPLLTFVGGQYHDIGKLVRSTVYAENAFLNASKKQNFTQNQTFIAQHTQRSIALARRYKIPSEVQAFMVSHHGTTRAFRHSKGVRSLAVHFHYAGPKPKTMEEALVMLADSCEASFRSHTPWKMTPAQLQTLFLRVIKGKVAEGQLSELTLRPMMMRRIAQRFTLFMSAAYHTRNT